MAILKSESRITIRKKGNSKPQAGKKSPNTTSSTPSADEFLDAGLKVEKTPIRVDQPKPGVLISSISLTTIGAAPPQAKDKIAIRTLLTRFRASLEPEDQERLFQEINGIRSTWNRVLPHFCWDSVIFEIFTCIAIHTGSS